MSQRREMASVVCPRTIEFQGTQFQFSVHKCPKSLFREFPFLFPECPAKNLEELLVIPTVQRADQDLVAVSALVDKEKDVLLENFFAFGNKLRSAIPTEFWLELVDPCSGQPVFGQRGSGIYSEADGFVKLLKYQVIQVGLCKVISHPEWATNIYPATIFTNAPESAVIMALEEIVDSKLQENI